MPSFNKMQQKIAGEISAVLDKNGIKDFALFAQDPDNPDGMITLVHYPNMFWARGMLAMMQDVVKMDFLAKNAGMWNQPKGETT